MRIPSVFASLAAFSLILTTLNADQCYPCNECDSCVQGGWVEARHREPNGIGYSPGYSTLEAFYAPDAGDYWYPFFDFRAHVFNDGKPAFNTGIGFRKLFECSNNVFGANIYWDYREAKHATFNQVGAGLEWLLPRWDFHINGYFPFTRHKKTYRTGFDGFSGHRAFFFKKYELAMTGGDAEIGYLFYTSDCFDLHGTLGGYTFHGDFGKNFSGGLLKLDVRLTDYITAEGQVSYDNHFKWIGQGELGLRFPFGREIKLLNRCLSSCDLNALERNLTSAPDRFEIIVTTHHKKKRAAINPLTGQPLNFIFVNNTSSSNGTFESPYPTLALAQANSQPGDVIYVFPGDGTTNGYNQGITLKNNQALVGSGFVLPVTTPFGVLDIPAQTTTSPTFERAGLASIVTLANNNLVRGLNLNTTGIGVNGANIINAQVQFNTFNCIDAGHAISMNPVDGTILIENNTIVGTGIDDVISLQNISGKTNSNITVRSNNVSSSSTDSTGIFMVSSGNNNYTSYNVENNFVANDFLGIVMINGSRVGNMIIRDNTLQSSVFESIQIQGDITGSLTYMYLKNNVMDNRLEIASQAGLVIAKETNNVAPSAALTKVGSGVLQVQSPNLALSGVQTINQFAAPIITTGTITFIPINQ